MNSTETLIINKYYDNLNILDIDKNGGRNVYKTLKKYNLPKRIPRKIVPNKKGNIENLKKNGKCKVQKTIEKYKAKSKITKGEYTYYEVLCSECYDFFFAPENSLRVSSLNGGLIICNACRLSDASNTGARCKKAKNNTTGFIGVSAIYGKKFIGYSATIMSKGIRVLNNKYKDNELHRKTLIQATVDRELFIIEKKLPHTRNFTENELLGQMEYLAHEQLKEFKTKVSNNKIVLNQ